MIRTFVDSGVLIEAYRASGPLAGPALAIFNNASRVFVTSEFVRLEVLPKPAHFGRSVEVAFYVRFFAAAKRSVPTTKRLVSLAMQRAEQFGLSAVDALHVAAAEIGKVDELITAERSTSPLLRITTVRVVSIRP
jgi:predicted nucleic acid-binding protein